MPHGPTWPPKQGSPPSEPWQRDSGRCLQREPPPPPHRCPRAPVFTSQEKSHEQSHCPCPAKGSRSRGKPDSAPCSAGHLPSAPRPRPSEVAWPVHTSTAALTTPHTQIQDCKPSSLGLSRVPLTPGAELASQGKQVLCVTGNVFWKQSQIELLSSRGHREDRQGALSTASDAPHPANRHCPPRRDL